MDDLKMLFSYYDMMDVQMYLYTKYRSKKKLKVGGEETIFTLSMDTYENLS